MDLKSYLRVRSPRFRDPEIVREKEGGFYMKPSDRGDRGVKRKDLLGF